MFQIFFLPLIFGYNIRVTEKAFAPSEVHDKCDQNELKDPHLECEMQGISMECSASSCGEEKFRCNCNVNSYFFTFYDETKCRWERVQQEPCTISTSIATTTGRVYKITE